MAITLAGVGAVASGVGSLLNGLGIGGGGGPDRKAARDSIRIANQEAVGHTQTMLRSIPSWQVDGFQKAGIHPLYGMGGGSSVAGVSPVALGDTASPPDFSAMGQGLDRALSAGQTVENQRLLKAGAMLDIERKQLENDVLRSQAIGSRMRLANTSAPPAYPNPDVVIDPSRSVASASANYGVEAATAPANKIYRAYDGSPILSPAPEYSESMEGNWPIGMLQHFGHNIAPWYWDLFKGWFNKKMGYNGDRRPVDRGGYTEWR